MALFSLLQDIMNYFQNAVRALRKNRAHSLLNIFGLAVGLACAGLIFLWVEDELSFDDNHLHKDQIYIVDVNEANSSGVLTHSSTPGALATVLPTMVNGVVNVCRTTEGTMTEVFHFDDKAVSAAGLYADPSLFQLFTLPFVEGNARSAFSNVSAVVVTEQAARKFFGDAKGCVGKTVTMDNKQSYVVTGVIKDIPENSSIRFEWAAPMENWLQQQPNSRGWGNFGLTTYVEMHPGANVAAVNAQLSEPKYDFTTQHREADVSKDHIFLFPMKDWRLRNQFEEGKATGSGRIQYVRLFSVIAWIVLFIACVNFMNLATARSEKRSREVGVRKVLGAERGSLIRHFLGESIFMAALSTILAVVLMGLTLPAFNLLVNKQLQLGVFQPLHFLGLIALTLVCGLVSGSYPSFYLSAFNPVFVLKGTTARSRTSPKQGTTLWTKFMKTGQATLIRRGLVVLQFTVSIVLIIGTIVIYLQVQHVKNRALGFDKDKLIQMIAQRNRVAQFPAIRQELLNTGVVSDAALADHTTLGAGNNTTAMSWPGKEPGSNVVVSQRMVSPEYIATLGMHLTEGRDFGPTDIMDLSLLSKARDSAVTCHVIVTRTMARLLGSGSAIGKTMELDFNSATIQMVVKGVVDDYVYGDMYGQPAPVVFYCMPPVTNLLYVRLKPGDPFEYTFVDDQFNALFLGETLISKLSQIFAFLAIFISCLGLFGLAAYTAESRIKEIGIRKVLGASTRGITYLLSRDFLKLTLLSCLVAFPLAAWIMYNWLQGYSYRISLSWWVFALAGGLAVFIALATVSFQAVRAALANPVKSLKAE
jgi:putative ABC transport system permease protein